MGKIKRLLKSHPKIKNIIKIVRKNIYRVFNFAYPVIKASMISKIRRLDQNTQPFLLTRHDLGTWLQILQYADLWRRSRGRVVVFVLSSYYSEILAIAKTLYPDLPLVCAGNWYTSLLKKAFGHFCLQTQTLNPIYGILRSYRLDSIVLYDMPMELEWPFKGAYNQQVDFRLKGAAYDLPTSFIDAYKKFRGYSQFRHDHLIDFGRLVAEEKKPQLDLNNRYVVLNINCKDYFDPILNRRRIHFPERYDVIIDELISRGYDVVLQGRDEQPVLRSRKGLIDYSKSNRVSLKNDMDLYSSCECIISSKTGPEIFGTIFDKPTLGLNYVEPSSIIPSKRLRYYPKKIRNNKTGKVLTWREYYTHPCFFNFGQIHFDTIEEHEYLDMSEEDLFESLIEFLQTDWSHYSPLQQEFKATLTPLHLEAYTSPGVPLDRLLQ